MRLIDADELKTAFPASENSTPVLIASVRATINHMPTIELERKRGRWIYGEDNLGTGRDGWFCSECGHFEMWDYSADMKSAELNLPNYCPHCGADMREVDDERPD